MNEIIKGSGGGGKSGGGSARVAVEAPNTLKSTQYARVLDLVSEGEIEGLVDGLSSVYIDNTALVDDQGNFNFTGVTFDYRTGVQSQEYIPGFSSVENEISVSTEIVKSTPVIRSITNPNVNAARITVSVPQLTEQDLKKGDLNGSSVTLQIHYKNNGGDWIPARINPVKTNFSISGNIATSASTKIFDASIKIVWTGTGIATSVLQVCSWLVEYRQTPSGSWTPLQTGEFSGRSSENNVFVPYGEGDFGGYYVKSILPPISSKTVTFHPPTDNTYEFRVTLISGTGTMSIESATGFYYVPDITISGKTVSNYQRSARIELPSPGPWDIRVSRVTPDSDKTALQNKTYFSSYTEIIDAKLSYPNSAVFGIQIDAKQFNSIPSRAYEIYGIKVKVPNNYNPITREYVGEWDGGFNVAWTNNPAWIFYDIVTNDRYGLGNFIDSSSVDKWGLYSIAKYCDEQVLDGLGSYEPRFTCNAYIQTRYEAYTLLSQLASIFRAMVFWSAGQITCVQDKPSDKVALFNASNVIDGQFNYSGSSVKTRHTVCLVTWNDPADRYKQKVEYVEDEEGIAVYGVVQTEIQAFGCTSRGQAHRLGKWLLFSERLETETVNFKAGMDAALVYPGAIIQTQDSFRSGKRFGGRLLSGSSATELNLDSSIEIEPGKTYEMSVVLSDGSVETTNVTSPIGTHSKLTVSPALSTPAITNAIWVLSASDLTPEEWRVVSITETEPGIVEIAALASRQDKYDAVEKDLILEPLNTTTVNLDAPIVTNLIVEESLYLVTPVVVGNSVTLSWTSSAPRFIVSYISDQINPVSIETSETSYTFNGIPIGEYTFSVQPANIFGRRGTVVSVTKEIYGLKASPSDVTGLSLNAISGNAHITFDPATDLDVKIGGHLRLKHARTSISWNDGIDLGVFIPGTATSAVVPLLQGNYLAKWVDSSGVESVNAVRIETNSPNIIKLNVVELIQEEPTFTGTKTNLGMSEFLGEPALTLDSSLTIDEMTSPIDSWPLFYAWGGVSSSGTYLFSNTVDLGNIYVSRLSADLESHGVNALDKIDNWGLIDSLLTIDGDVVSDVSAGLFVKQSDDGIIYSEWKPFVVGEYSSRFFQFKLELSSSGDSNIVVTKCSVIIDMPDTLYSENDIISGTSTYSIVYPTPFYNVSAIGITAQDMQTGDYYEITNKTVSGFDITFKNSSSIIVSKTFDYISKGY